MISKEHLVYRETAEGIKPSFISDRGVWLERCSMLLESLQKSIGQTQQACDEVFREWVSLGEGGVMVRRGLLQTLQKKMVWEEMEGSTWEDHRHVALAKSAELWANTESLDQFEVQLKKLRSETEPLYGDLPHCRKLLELPKWDAQQWVRRYNLALAQGFVMQSESMEWVLDEVNLEKMRYLMRYLKFFGLMYRVVDQGESKMTFKIEGPLNLFAGLKRYQMKMAAATGILPQIENFEVKAKLNLPETKRDLVWSSKDRVKSHYRSFFDYCSDEREQFETKFFAWLEKSSCELIEPTYKMADLVSEGVPDYSLQNASKKILKIHIYEQHQLNMLKHRLKKVKNEDDIILLLERGLETHLSDVEKNKVILFNKIPSFSALKKKMKELSFE